MSSVLATGRIEHVPVGELALWPAGPRTGSLTRVRDVFDREADVADTTR